MKDGYYLTIYSDIDPYLNSIEASMRHDHNMSLWKKEKQEIELIRHWEFERISGIKHHSISFYNEDELKQWINTLLSECNLCLDDMVHVIGTPSINTCDAFYSDDFGVDFTYHSISHAFSSIMMNSETFFNETILSFVLDGSSDCVIDKDSIDRYNFICILSRKGKIAYHQIESPGPFWDIMKEMLGLQEGSLMALATASKSKVLECLYNKEDIPHSYSEKDLLAVSSFVKKIKECIYSYTDQDIGTAFNGWDSNFSKEENRKSMIAKIVQEISIQIMDNMVESALKLYSINPEDTILSLAGGYALNCPTNTHLMNKFGFKHQMIAPCVNDGGQAIGMGLYYFYKMEGNISFQLKHSYYGCTDNCIPETFSEFIDNISDGLEQFADDLCESPVIWFDGAAEIGPRSLGHRSLLADPRNPNSKDLLNLYKQRQWWRPVAPIVLNDFVDEWFEDSFKSPYMLNNFIVNAQKKHLVPAIIHEDGTARVQTLDIHTNPRLYYAMQLFYEKTSVPIVCNTSLNDRGEPIINTVGEALNFALRKGIRIAYINGKRIQLNNHGQYHCSEPEKRNRVPLVIHDNPYLECDLSFLQYAFYYVHRELHKYSLNNKKDIQIIKRIIEKSSLFERNF